MFHAVSYRNSYMLYIVCTGVRATATGINYLYHVVYGIFLGRELRIPRALQLR
jgi:hypothetical protein